MTVHTQGVAKYGFVTTMSHGAIATATEFRAGFDRWFNSTPEERAEWKRQADERRVQERAVAETVPLTMDNLLSKLGFTEEYARHLVQPYCECYDGMDGWEYCEHARDLGLTRC